MHFVKWIRKNQRKLITAIGIMIMVAFVGGQAFQYLMSHFRLGANTAVYLYYENSKISSKTINEARNKLDVLQALMAGKLLSNLDIKSMLLAQLLFPNSVPGVQVNDILKQSVMQGQLNCDFEDIDRFFAQAAGRSELFWILLDGEAKNAGCVVSAEEAKVMLKQLIPSLTQGQADARQVIDGIINRYSIPEEKIFRIFADLIGVITHCRMITGSEDVTATQIKAAIVRSGQELSSEFVKISAEDFIDDQPEPTEEELYQQFAKYKQFLPGRVTAENPYGFGYHLPDRAQLEYLFVKRSDVENIIKDPTQQEMEEHYQLNSDRYTYPPEKIDPNDPDSETITRKRSYAEASELIKRTLKRENTQRRCDMIINEAIDMIDVSLANIDVESSSDQELADVVGDYAAVAEKLKEKYNVDVYSGKTGMLSAEDIVNDRYLGRIMLKGQTQMPIPLSKVIFAVDGTTKLTQFEIPTPRMWENIGPIRDSVGSIVGIVRVTKVEKAVEPTTFELSYSIEPVNLNQTNDPEEKYSLRQVVAEDVKIQKAMDSAKVRAQELVKSITEKGWATAISQYNQNYTTGLVRLENVSQLRSVSQREILVGKMISKDNPAQIIGLKNVLLKKEQFNSLSSLIPAGETEAKNIMQIVRFEPDWCYYVVKDVSRTPVTEADYLAVKNQAAYQVDTASSESLGVIHYLPENIIKRTNFRSAKNSEENTEEEGDQDGDS
ncbi:MAG: hypothetical protein JW912_03175 [Sedimentisphaerales bacterium]|nr:hypothetical protein [Sedimentisphaerales bacterium]